MEFLVDGAVVPRMRVGAFASRGAGSFQGPREADWLACMLGDLHIFSPDHGGDVRVAAVLVAFGQALVGMGVHNRGVRAAGSRDIGRWGRVGLGRSAAARAVNDLVPVSRERSEALGTVGLYELDDGSKGGRRRARLLPRCLGTGSNPAVPCQRPECLPCVRPCAGGEGR